MSKIVSPLSFNRRCLGFRDPLRNNETLALLILHNIFIIATNATKVKVWIELQGSILEIGPTAVNLWFDILFTSLSTRTTHHENEGSYGMVTNHSGRLKPVVGLADLPWYLFCC
jgi:hypothetical protein